jgi:hypothetical protein
MPAARKLDARLSLDPRNADFPIRPLLGRVRRGQRMHLAPPWVLDQGREGACVGHGWTSELGASPVRVKLPNAQQYAFDLYHAAQRIDEWRGEDYDGTSVLAGAKVLRGAGYIQGFRWAKTIDDVIDTLVAEGPVVVGVPWLTSMYDTRPSGLVEVSGRIEGLHCLVLTGYSPSYRLFGEGGRGKELIRWRNSWGKGYGRLGDGFVLVEDFERLLTGGEACVPVGRSLTTAG